MSRKLKKRKIPLRKCIACGESKPKHELIRIVKNKEGDLNIDPTGKMNGRGAYICLDRGCLEMARKNKGFNKALKIEIPDEIYDKLDSMIDVD